MFHFSREHCEFQPIDVYLLIVPGVKLSTLNCAFRCSLVSPLIRMRQGFSESSDLSKLSSLEAIFTVSPITVYSSLWALPTLPTVNSPVQDIVNAMVPLRESFLSADKLLPEPCETRDPEQVGSFIVDSNEGFPPRPDELLK